jgi:putative sterol carrier protein
MEPINKLGSFKELYADTKLSFLYNLTDQRFAALINVDDGTLELKHIDKNEEDLKNFNVDGGMECSTRLFFDFSGGKISKLGALGKMITGKLKVRGTKQMKELQNIMALLTD